MYMKKIIYYKALNDRCYIQEWKDALFKKDKVNFHLVNMRLIRLQNGNFGDYKSLGGDLYELRFKNGLRIYYTIVGKEIVVLFYGGDKSGGKRGQQKDIAKARELLQEFKRG